MVQYLVKSDSIPPRIESIAYEYMIKDWEDKSYIDSVITYDSGDSQFTPRTTTDEMNTEEPNIAYETGMNVQTISMHSESVETEQFQAEANEGLLL